MAVPPLQVDAPGLWAAVCQGDAPTDWCKLCLHDGGGVCGIVDCGVVFKKGVKRVFVGFGVPVCQSHSDAVARLLRSHIMSDVVVGEAGVAPKKKRGRPLKALSAKKEKPLLFQPLTISSPGCTVEQAALQTRIIR